MKKSAREAEDRMISGKLRPKAGRRGADNKVITLEGIDYVWAPRHGFEVHGKGIKALSFSVSLLPGRTRELILEFVLEVRDEPDSPARVARVLEAGIRKAIAAGWDPESRGRAFRHQTEEGA